MPTALSPGAAVPPAPVQVPSSFAVSYPAAVGAAGPTISLGSLMSAGTQVYQGPDQGVYSDAWLEILNYSDSVLAPQFDVTGTPHPNIPAGYAWSAPIPVGATYCFTTIALQTTTQQFPNEALFATFYTAADIRAGFRPRSGPLVPSVPAPSIGPGTLPAGVHIPGSQVTSGIYVAGFIKRLSITDNLAHGFLLITVPAIDTWYRCNATFRSNASVIGAITFGVSYTAAFGNVAQTDYFAGNLGGATLIVFNGGATTSNAVYACVPLVIQAKASTGVTITYTDSGTSPNDLVGAFVETLS